ncbi:Holliday junction branch migration protein RuvA [Candidatus Peregrinibacteria bacterium]|nr:Holliday junction branch migration protein RuvA [Candidatus Peregrinibacteria bacterium]
MIAFLSGTLYKKEPRAILIDVQGVGYRVFTTLSAMSHLHEKQPVFLFTHHHIREDDQTLYGFLKESDLKFFEKLISVSGIGPKSALEIMEVSPSLVHEAIVKGDVDFLKTLKGIGKKTAERMVLELRGNLPEIGIGQEESLPPEVVQALKDLGFERNQIQKTFLELKKPLPSPEEMVRWFLQKSAL